MSARSSHPRPPFRALLVGGSGLVGRQVLNTLLDTPACAQVHAWMRRPLARAHDKLSQQVVDFERLDRVAVPEIDAVFCCLGTTLRVAGSRAAFRRVDHDHVLACARAARAAGAGHFILVSAIGADARSRVFYSRVKGETEADVCALGYPSVTLVRPSLLTGERAEWRLGERLAIGILSPLAFLVPARYRPVADIAVARAMVDAAARGRPGVEIIESDRLQAFH